MYSSIGLTALALRKVFQSLGLVAHGALELDDLRTRTGLTIDGLEVLNALADLVAEFVELFGRVLGLRKILVASAALNLHRKLYAFEPMLLLSAQVPKSAVQQVD
jgi:hypothetical protein